MLQTGSDPRRLMRRPPNYVSNEVIVTAVAGARNDDLPHYLRRQEQLNGEHRMILYYYSYQTV